MIVKQVSKESGSDFASRWRRHFVYRTQSVKTTWKCRLAIVSFVILIVSLTSGFWIPALGRSLTCTEEVGLSDIILVENFDTDYLLFERAAALEKAGLAATVLVPTEASRHNPEAANTISRGIVELMARVARVQNLKIIPTRYSEPISLNVAYQIRDSLIKEHLRSVILVTPALRSRRSSLVYRAVLRPAGIQVYCVPVLDDYTPETWTATLHGIEQVTQQFIKLQFYRFYVLPLSRGQSSRADPDYRSRSPSATGQLGRLESHHARLQLVSKPIDNMLIVALQRHALARGLIVAFISEAGVPAADAGKVAG